MVGSGALNSRFGIKVAAAALAVALAAAGCNPAVGRAAVWITLLAVDAMDEDPFTEAIGSHGVVATLTRGGSHSGGTEGLYGGTRGKASCDKKKLVNFLKRNPAKRNAWAKALGIAVDQVGPYIAELTPVLLRSDTLVRNHGYKNGKATGFESILQAGIAVLIDKYGQPAVKCSCGNPLTAPAEEIDIDPKKIKGTGWGKKKFSKKNVTVVTPNKSGVLFLKEKAPIESVEFHDAQADTLVRREQGTSGSGDVVVTTPTESPTATSTPTVTVTPTPTDTPTAPSTLEPSTPVAEEVSPTP